MKRPVEPDFIKGSKFVSGIYGTKNSPIVSIDGDHFYMTKEQEEELIQYRSELSRYEESVVADIVADMLGESVQLSGSPEQIEKAEQIRKDAYKKAAYGLLEVSGNFYIKDDHVLRDQIHTSWLVFRIFECFNDIDLKKRFYKKYGEGNPDEKVYCKDIVSSLTKIEDSNIWIKSYQYIPVKEGMHILLNDKI